MHGFGQNIIRNQRYLRLIEGISMEEMPLWFRMVIYLTVGLTILYAAWGAIQSLLQS